MKQLAIKAENISKQYRLGEVGTGTLSHDLNRFWHKIRGNEDPYLKIGEVNDRSKKGDSEYVWSLRDINFEIEQGDAVGIIGRNGAGKSTLLKLLSKVTKPTTGHFKVNGRIASLLEVGTGFHPEMTGRENIYLNGAILGMRRHEITRKFDEIVAFSGVGGYIDTPVKRYSSGMYVRLAFAVAAHLESEILIVDEVLAVGDAEFQKKCLGKMGDVSKGEGRTVLFVSHNMASVKALCNRSILLEHGSLKLSGPTDEIIKKYLGGDTMDMNHRFIQLDFEGIYIEDVALYNPEHGLNSSIYRDSDIYFRINFNNLKNIKNLYFNIKLKDEEGKYFLVTTSSHEKDLIREGQNTAIMRIPAGFFNEGSYALEFMIIQKNEIGYKVFMHEPDLLHVQILPEKRDLGLWMGKEVGYIRQTFEWTT